MCPRGMSAHKERAHNLQHGRTRDLLFYRDLKNSVFDLS